MNEPQQASVIRKSVVPLELALRDTQEIVEAYVRSNAQRAAQGFVDAVEQAYEHIGTYPASGSLRLARELDLPGLHFWPLRKFPHLIFYFIRSDRVEVWRVIHGRRAVRIDAGFIEMRRHLGLLSPS